MCAMASGSGVWRRGVTTRSSRAISNDAAGSTIRAAMPSTCCRGDLRRIRVLGSCALQNSLLQSRLLELDHSCLTRYATAKDERIVRTNTLTSYCAFVLVRQRGNGSGDHELLFRNRSGDDTARVGTATNAGTIDSLLRWQHLAKEPASSASVSSTIRVCRSFARWGTVCGVNRIQVAQQRALRHEAIAIRRFRKRRFPE